MLFQSTVIRDYAVVSVSFGGTSEIEIVAQLDRFRFRNASLLPCKTSTILGELRRCEHFREKEKQEERGGNTDEDGKQCVLFVNVNITRGDVFLVGGRQEYKRIEELTTCCWIETQKEDKCREGKTTLSESRETAFITFSTIREFTLVTRAPN
ncbi:hypothetical protein KQX54_004257 [Cotesia glomerata]|uniref:Uncharacterized protein n=1 Tax=Cotesia glomerata TaxID=32391 RepID=A0AAV7J5B3_COTGL|nr:hypothetical protein KQX54_004257 [Cotesia glomerata]